MGQQMRLAGLTDDWPAVFVVWYAFLLQINVQARNYKLRHAGVMQAREKLRKIAGTRGEPPHNAVSPQYNAGIYTNKRIDSRCSASRPGGEHRPVW